MSLRGEQRQEFPQKVRKAAFARCCIDAVPHCESCGIELKPGNIEYEHLIPDGMGGEPTLENCGVWCRSACSKKKTFSEDNPRMAKADAVPKASYGLQRKKQPIRSQGFAKRKPQRTASSPIKRKVY